MLVRIMAFAQGIVAANRLYGLMGTQCLWRAPNFAKSKIVSGPRPISFGRIRG